MILSGTIASTVQLQMLNNKWMQKKESGNVLSKQELNERSTWTSEQFMIADFQDQLEHNREAEKRQKIDNKIMSGGSLSPEEISYLEKNDPVALKKYRETKEEKESYKEKLRQCKTKEEVDRVKLQKLGELESSLSSIVNDPAIPKSAKLAKAQEILAKTNNIEAAHLEFVKSADYQSMPTDEEKKEAENLAKEIITKLNEGKSFDEVKDEYKDKITYEELGYKAYNASLESAYMEAMQKLENNSYTKEPVQTSYGYHVIYRIDQKEKPALKDVKEEIITSLVSEHKSKDTSVQYKALDKMREDAKLKFTDTVLEKKYETYKSQYNK